MTSAAITPDSGDFDGLHVLVNNAARTQAAPLMELTREELDAILRFYDESDKVIDSALDPRMPQCRVPAR